MAKIANTFVSTDAVGNREELSDVVNMITPEDTPIYSMIKKTGAKSTNPEWEKDDLATPKENAQPEGDEYNFEALSPPERLGNHTQIFRKTLIVSNTQEAVDNAGRQEKVKRQKLKRGVEIRKDVEFALLGNTASKKIDPRKMGSLASFYESNVSRGRGGANGGFVDRTGLTAAATNGAQRAFSKTLLDGTMQQAYQSGGNVTRAIVSPYVKSVFTKFMSDANVAQFRYAASGGMNTIIATADVYEGDFGKVMIIPNRVMATGAATARNVHLIDPGMLEFKWLRKIKEDKNLAKTGDAMKMAMVGEGTLCVKNEAGIGVVADVFGLTAAS
ncbi:DUF5309 domain-containing protein [Tateyamaria sp.]|uniref:DUF5309 domain-containing protein n=1 Tax=Tateyamaria sp. TaxID=1929288 RepID=UPI003B212994